MTKLVTSTHWGLLALPVLHSGAFPSLVTEDIHDIWQSLFAGFGPFLWPHPPQAQGVIDDPFLSARNSLLFFVAVLGGAVGWKLEVSLSRGRGNHWQAWVETGTGNTKICINLHIKKVHDFRVKPTQPD